MTRPPALDPRALVEALRDGLAVLDPALLVEAALPPRPRGRVVVVAAGKAALAMAHGALHGLGDAVDAGLVVTTDAIPSEGRCDNCAARLLVLRAAHPLPDTRSVAAADAALALASGLGQHDLLLSLLSGGASALLAAPPHAVSLDEKRTLVAALLDAGAPIQDVNVVRRHISRVKGGRLAAAAAPAGVTTLLLSDVIGGLPHDVGSGPTVPDPTTTEHARAALHRWAPHLHHLAPHFEESIKPSSSLRADTQILADPSLLARHVATALMARAGLHTTPAQPETGDGGPMVERRLAQARALAPGEALVIPCEPTLTLPVARGRGGRAGWIALAAMRDLPNDTALLCAATDGMDGSSGAAGAVVTCADARAAPPGVIDAALRAFDDAAVHSLLGTRIDGEPTGHNLTDLHIVARAPRG